MKAGDKKMEEKLKAYGFVKDYRDDADILKLNISERGDRFSTEIWVYTDELDHFYVQRHFFLRGLATISADDVLSNFNNLHTGALENYKKFTAVFPEMKPAY